MDVDENRQTVHIAWQHRHHWNSHCLRHDELQMIYINSTRDSREIN